MHRVLTRVLQLSEQLNTDDYITTLETSNDVQELEAVMECLVEEIATLRERDNDGARGRREGGDCGREE